MSASPRRAADWGGWFNRLLHADLRTLAPFLGRLFRLGAVGFGQFAEDFLQAIVGQPARLGNQMPLGSLDQAGLYAGTLRQAACQPDLRRGEPLLRGGAEK